MADDHDSACTADDDLRIVRQVMEEADLRHAAFHVACALNTSPQDADALALADALLRRSADPFSLAPLKQENFAGTVALRVRFLQQRGRHGEALPLVADILGATKNLDLLDWGCASIAALGSDLELPTLLRLTGQLWATQVARRGADDRRGLAQLVALLRCARAKIRRGRRLPHSWQPDPAQGGRS